MQAKKIVQLLLFIGLFVFHILFWKEGQGLNLVFFTIFSLATLSFTDITRWQSTFFKLTAVGTSLLSVFVVWNHSDVSIICFWLSWVLLIGIAYAPNLYYLLYALMQGLENIFAMPRGFSQLKMQKNEEIGFVPEKSTGLRPSLFLIPLSILSIFVILYMVGNLDFAKAVGDIFEAIFKNLDWLWALFSFEWIAFMGFAMFLIGGLIWKNSVNSWEKAQLAHIFDIKKSDILPNMATINDRYWVAFLTLAMLNVLILIVNTQDFNSIVHTQSVDAGTMRYSVHFGTYILIFSIIVAMGLLFYFFSNDLNFIEKASSLQLLAYVWIAQNAIMVIAVFSRNYLYISHYGLAYKRIGVVFFLLLVLFGLYTMVLKVQKKRTFNYLFHVNTWAVYVMFILISAVNWDVFITQYNLRYTDKDKLDAAFLISQVSDKNLKILFENEAHLPLSVNYRDSGFFYDNNYEQNTKTLLEQKRNTFLEKNKGGLSFLSWNYPDYQNSMYFVKY
jgi:hypothetical protein